LLRQAARVKVQTGGHGIMEAHAAFYYFEDSIDLQSAVTHVGACNKVSECLVSLQ